MRSSRRHLVHAVLGVTLPLAIATGVVATVVDEWDRGTVQAVGGSASAMVGLLAFLLLRLSTRVERATVRAITERARAISVGHIGAHEPVPERGSREVGELASSFNVMVRRVRDTVDELETSQVAIRRAVQRLGEVLDATHDPDAIIAAAVETARSVVGGRTAVHWALRSERLVPEVLDGEQRVDASMGAGEGLAGRAATTGEALLADHTPRGPSEPADRDALAVPLAVAGSRLGVIAVYGRDGPPRPFTADDLSTVATLARQAETALDNARLHEEATLQSRTDPLTSLPNRRELERRLSEEIERSARFGEPFTLVLLDVDDFKAVNDAHGHPAGDAVLVELAQRLTGLTRDVDTVGRVGGEELAVVLPRADAVTAATVAIRMRKAIAAKPFDLGPDTDGPLAVTCSFGLASFPEHGATIDGLFAAADRALYRAKRAGKNRVERAVTRPPEESAP